MVLNYKGRHVIDNWTDINYLQYVQSRWGLRTPSMLRASYPTLLHWREEWVGTICPVSRPEAGYHTWSENNNRVFTHSLDVDWNACKCYLQLILHRNFIFSQKAWIWVYLHNNSSLMSHFGLSCPPVTCWCLTQWYFHVHVFRCPRHTQHLRFETFVRPEDYTDWERAPPSNDPQSWGSLD